MQLLKSVAIVVLLSGYAAAEPAVTHGPFVGHVEPTRALIWARVAEEGQYEVSVFDQGAALAPVRSGSARAMAANDFCVVWEIGELAARRTYGYQVRQGNRVLADGEELTFRTPPEPGEPARVRIAFGSCADDRDFKRQPVWKQIAESGAKAVALLGDTPYIDSTDLNVQRRRYREFYSVPELASALRRTPFYGSWDDHDFGADDSDGRLEGKAHSRRAFIDYHANPSYGDGENGVYTKFRRGPIEVFLLDTRWFARTEPSPVAPDKPTLLGASQWNWLKRELTASTATFKVLASGMIWNGAVRPGKQDHWTAYPHEREALFRFIGEARVSGVVLMGGDIHRSRALRHPTRELVGYELTELIASPLAQGVMKIADVPSPYLLHDAGYEHTFFLLTADTIAQPATLTAQCLAADGQELFHVRLNERELMADE